MSTKQILLPAIHNFEEYEIFKSNIAVFENAAKHIMRQHFLPELELTLFVEGTNIVFEYGKNQVIKLFPPFHKSQYQSEWLLLNHLQGKLTVNTPILQHRGELCGWPYIVMTKLEGTLLETLWGNMEHDNKIVIIRELGALIKEVHSLPIDGLEPIDSNWKIFIKKQLANCLEQHQSKKLPLHLLKQLPAYLDLIKTNLPQIKAPVILTGEYTPMNFLVKQKDGLWHIDGLIDFGDAMLGLPEYDLLGPGAFLIMGDKELLQEFLKAYGFSSEQLTDSLSQQLMGLMILHQYSNLNVQLRIDGWERSETLEELQNLVWGF